MTSPEPAVPPQAITDDLPPAVAAGMATLDRLSPKGWLSNEAIVRSVLEAAAPHLEAAARERCAQLAEQEAGSGQKLGLTRIALRAFAQRLREGGEGGGT